MHFCVIQNVLLTPVVFTYLIICCTRPREDVNASNRGEQVEKSGAPEDEDQSGFRVRSNRSNRQRSENEPSHVDGTDKVERPFGTGEAGGESFRGRGFGRGRGVGGRGRGRGGFERGGRREFDRHSGSDRGFVLKIFAFFNSQF